MDNYMRDTSGDEFSDSETNNPLKGNCASLKASV